MTEYCRREEIKQLYPRFDPTPHGPLGTARTLDLALDISTAGYEQHCIVTGGLSECPQEWPLGFVTAA